MRLAQMQEAFMARILDAEQPLPDGWGEDQAAGMHVYRGNYRTALVETLRDSFIKTECWTGEAPFKQAAINHVISQSCNSWTIDDVGEGFDQTCAQFFTQSPEVAELAWLEWTMLKAFSAPDSSALDLERFNHAISDFADGDWINLHIAFVPELKGQLVGHDLRAMWNFQPENARPEPKLAEGQERGVMVWREGERASFRMAMADEIGALHAAQSGQTYGEICLMLAGGDADPDRVQAAARRAGEMLGGWAKEGLITGLKA